MKSGTLDRRINIEVKSIVRQTDGYDAKTWSVHLSVWAQKEHETGKEQTDNNNRSTDRMVKFKTRYHSTVTNEMRIFWNSGYYKIEDIKELGREDGLLIFTSLLTQT